MPDSPTPEQQKAKITESVFDEEADLSLEFDRKTLESSTEQKDEFLEQIVDKTEGSVQTAASPQIVTDSQNQPLNSSANEPVQDALFDEVEKILEHGMGLHYEALPEPAKTRFLQKGKEIAEQITDMIRKLQVHVGDVLRLIRDWLLTIPGVNKFFLEQEAKIKSDQILDLERRTKEEVSNENSAEQK